jgi:hypothetical protein
LEIEMKNTQFTPLLKRPATLACCSLWVFFIGAWQADTPSRVNLELGPPPTISGITPSRGPTTGSPVTITGKNFVSGASVRFGQAPATTVTVASTTIAVTAPAHTSGTVNVTVTNPDNQSATFAGVFQLIPNPGFEAGAADWQSAGGGAVAVESNSANAEQGSKYLVMTSNPGSYERYYATDSSGINQYYPVMPGDLISFGGGVYRLAGDGLARYVLLVTDANKKLLQMVNTTPNNGTTQLWADLTGDFTVPTGAAFIRFAAAISGNALAAQVRFDNSSVQRTIAGRGYTYTGPSSPGVFTYHNDNFRTGQNAQETILTPANVNQKTFGKLFSYAVDGWIKAQPLSVANVMINGILQNVVYVATEHDSVYAFDAEGKRSTAFWQRTFINAAAGITTVPGVDVYPASIPLVDQQPEFGITATPVIDPISRTMYVLARTKENGNYAQRLHALDIATGKERTGSPVRIQATVLGTGDGSVGGRVSYDSLRQNVRPGLALSNGVIYLASASIGDSRPYHGWILGFDSKTLGLVGAHNATPDGAKGGIWQSGAAPAVDDLGDLYVMTGNGTFDADVGGRDHGDSILRLRHTLSGLRLVDSFTPHNQAVLNSNDLDLSGGVLLLPDQPGAHPKELIGGGKEGTLYVLDRDAMGGYNSLNDSQIVQLLPGALTSTTDTIDGGLWSAPTYWRGRVYFSGRHDVLKVFGLWDGLLFGPICKRTNSMTFVTTAISANGTANGILWANLGNTLRAYNPYDVNMEFYNTLQVATRDTPGGITKFSVPTIVNGKVFVGTSKELDVYGLF